MCKALGLIPNTTKNNKNKRTGSEGVIGQVVEYSQIKSKALGSIPNTTKKREKITVLPHYLI
jgi:hypothetical protein